MWLGQGIREMFAFFHRLVLKDSHEIHEIKTRNTRNKTETEEVITNSHCGVFGFSKIEKSCVWVEAKNPVATARGSDPGVVARAHLLEMPM